MRRRYRQDIIENLDMTLEHMGYEQTSESNKTHTEESKFQNLAERTRQAMSLKKFQLNLHTQD